MQDFPTLIKNWYRLNARDLPWRRTNDPYAIWLSEIILQQTRVDQGLDYYIKFLKHYPTVHELAKASEDEVLRDWQGLGYYSRARNLHLAAKYIATDLKGEFPKTYSSVIDLKGVGDYTAAAICSFAYSLPHAVVDGNVYRVLSRYLGIDTPIDSTLGKKKFKILANEMLDVQDPATYNQAIMEMGALVCKPKKPTCELCPVVESCVARSNGNQLSLPVKEKKIKVRNRFLNYFVVLDDGWVYLKKRGAKDIWQGLYDFPLLEMDKKESVDNLNLKELGVEIVGLDGEFKHVLSHQNIHARFWIANKLPSSKLDKAFVRVKVSELEDYPMPQLLIRYIESTGVFRAD
jgi:A/G-specific adenine glycosylase